jgi:hypothetical protein
MSSGHNISVPYPLVNELAARLWDRELAGRLQRAVENETRLLAVDDDEVVAILSAMEDPPAGIAELRGRLLTHMRTRPA